MRMKPNTRGRGTEKSPKGFLEDAWSIYQPRAGVQAKVDNQKPNKANLCKMSRMQ